MNQTLYQVVVDPLSCFPGAGTVRLKNITDGTSETVTVIEMMQGNSVEWISPNDTNMTSISAINANSKPVHSEVIHALFADGRVEAIPVESSNDLLRAKITIAEADAHHNHNPTR